MNLKNQTEKLYIFNNLIVNFAINLSEYFVTLIDYQKSFVLLRWCICRSLTLSVTQFPSKHSLQTVNFANFMRKKSAVKIRFNLLLQQFGFPVSYTEFLF